MYSQAHISLFNIYWRVWLLVIRGAEKVTLGSMGVRLQFYGMVLSVCGVVYQLVSLHELSYKISEAFKFL